MVIQSFTFLTHSVSLDSLEVSSGLVEMHYILYTLYTIYTLLKKSVPVLQWRVLLVFGEAFFGPRSAFKVYIVEYHQYNNGNESHIF